MASVAEVNTTLEGQLIARSPLFNDNNYAYWKTRMRNFIISSYVEVWKIIKDGPHVPKKTIEGVVCDKEDSKYEAAD